jgi:hypothetical protein
MALAPFEILTLMRDTLAIVPGVASCKIGIEANVTAADYPLIRLVPTRLSAQAPDFSRATLALTIYFGEQWLEAVDGLDEVYAGLLNLESAIREAVLFTTARAAWNAGQRLTITYLDTVFDEDRLPHYKIMASRFEVEG